MITVAASLCVARRRLASLSPQALFTGRPWSRQLMPAMYYAHRHYLKARDNVARASISDGALDNLGQLDAADGVDDAS